jgi:hypothetical protein
MLAKSVNLWSVAGSSDEGGDKVIKAIWKLY